MNDHFPRRCYSMATVGVGILAGWLAAIAQTRTPVLGGVTIEGQSAKLQVSDPRPLAEALYQLSKSFHWRIGFEEAELRYAGDLVDTTSPEYVSKDKNDRAFIPRGGSLDLRFSVSRETGQPVDPIAVIRGLLTEHRARGYPGRYSFTAPAEKTGYYYVFPEQVANERGVFDKTNPVTRIRLSVAVRDGEKLIGVLQEVKLDVGKTAGKEVLYAGFGLPQALVQPAPRQFVGVGDSFLVFLNKIASAQAVDFWQVLYDPTGRFYVLSFRK